MRVCGNIDIEHLATSDLLLVVCRVESARSYRFERCAKDCKESLNQEWPQALRSYLQFGFETAMSRS